MSPHLYHFTLVNFGGDVIRKCSYEYERPHSAVARAFRLFWETDHCSAVLIESDWGFNMNLEWGVWKSF